VSGVLQGDAPLLQQNVLNSHGQGCHKKPEPDKGAVSEIAYKEPHKEPELYGGDDVEIECIMRTGAHEHPLDGPGSPEDQIDEVEPGNAPKTELAQQLAVEVVGVEIIVKELPARLCIAADTHAEHGPLDHHGDPVDQSQIPVRGGPARVDSLLDGGHVGEIVGRGQGEKEDDEDTCDEPGLEPVAEK